jgi:hypothetical protein
MLARPFSGSRQGVYVAALGVLLCAAVAATITLVEGIDSALIAWGAAIGLAVLTALTLRDRTTSGLVMVYGYLVFGAAAAVLYHPTARQFYGATPYIANFAASTPGYHYLEFFTLVGFSAWVGFFIFAPRKDPEHVVRVGDLGRGISGVSALPAAVFVLALLPLLLDAYGTGFHTILYASHYLERTGPPTAFKIGRALGPIGLLVSGYFIFAETPTRNKVLAVLVAFGYALLYLGTDTRNFGLVVPMVYLGGLLSGHMSTRQRRIGLVVSAVAAILMVQIPIALRGLPNHGLVASLQYLIHQPHLLLADPLNNLLYGAPETLYLGKYVGSIPLHDLATSLSPLPGSLTDWAQIAPTLQLNSFTPYSGLGELLNYGWPYLCLGLAATGALYALLERLVRRSIAPRLGLLVLCAIAALTVVRSTEYNLRSLARLSYYVTAVVILMVVVPAILRRREPTAAPTQYPLAEGPRWG